MSHLPKLRGPEANAHSTLLVFALHPRAVQAANTSLLTASALQHPAHAGSVSRSLPTSLGSSAPSSAASLPCAPLLLSRWVLELFGSFFPWSDDCRCARCGDMSVSVPPPPHGVPTGPPGRPEAGEPTLGLSDTSPDQGLAEDLPADDRAVEQLAEGLLSHYLPDLQRSKQALQELTQNQAILLDTLEQEISKFKECHSVLDISALFTEAKHYHTKLVNIRKEMLMLHEKTLKLKKRALKLQQKRQKEELEREQQREKEFEREKQLTAKPAKRT